MTTVEMLPLTERLTENIDNAFYDKLLERCELVEVWDGKKYVKLDPESVQIFANYSWLIYEFYHLNKLREVNYYQVKNFAVKYKEIFEYIFDFGVVKNKFSRWIKEEIDGARMGMYGITNAYNKNVYH